jgi:hypothetical protein
MKNKSTNLILFILILFSCKKQIDNSITISGKIIDAQTSLPVPSYNLSLSFIDGTRTWGGLNLGSYNNIINSTTNQNGEYRLKINRLFAKNILDTYKIESLSSSNYFGCSKELNAKNVEALTNNTIENIKVYKRLDVNFYIHHSGINNPTDYIFVSIYNGFFNDRSDSFYGTDSIKQNNYEVVPNLKYGITKRGIKNGIQFGPVTDSIIFTATNNNFNIYY